MFLGADENLAARREGCSPDTTMVRLALRFLPIVAVLAGTMDARAADDRIAIGELTAAPGVEYAALADAAKLELGALDSSHVKRRVVVSLAVVRNEDAPVSVLIDAMVRDRKTGTMLAAIRGRAHAPDAGSSLETRKAVLRAAVRCALSQVPAAAR